MAIQAQLYSENLRFPMCGSQDWMDNSGCGFNEVGFNLQQKLQQQQQYMLLQNQQQRNQNVCFGDSFLGSTLKNNNTTNNNNLMSMTYSQDIAGHIEKQRQEIDQYIRLQNERLRLELQEQRKQQLAILLKKIESRTQILLRQKDQEIVQAANRTMELECFLRKLEMESQAWQKVAQENEAMVVSLNNTLEQLRDKTCCSVTNEAEDAESCCDVNRGDREAEEETGENTGIGGDEVEAEQRTRKMMCKGCNSRGSSVVFLPCRHLCSCKVCEAFLGSCPVCQTVKKASIEALIF